MEKLIKQVERLIDKAIMYDIKGISEIKKELDELAEPFLNELEELKQNESVKRYIRAESKNAYIYRCKQSLTGYLPK
jgi:mRNA-degrading endonuclease RelE of RelBE toxin-antitoxin system